MNAQHSPDSPDGELDEVLAIINALARKSVSANYIYRGETQRYDKVSSSLYREYPDAPDIEAIQGAYLDEAELYTPETDRFAILTELQHYGGSTNLIDFTTDYLIALFFACDGGHTQDGRIVLLDRIGDMREHIRAPQTPARRVLAQKSIFVRPPAGYVEPDDTVIIPRHLKVPILNYLQDGHGVSTETIYNDLFGFIRSRAIHREAFEHFSAAISHIANGNYPAAIEECTRALDRNPQMAAAYHTRGIAHRYVGNVSDAIIDFTRTIELIPGFAEAFNNRGIANHRKGDYDQAIEDFNQSIALAPNEAAAYNNRGASYGSKGEDDQAITDFDRAIELEPYSATSYNNRGTSYRYKGDYNRAIADYDQAIALAPDNANYYGNLGESWLHLSDWGKARANLIAARQMGADIVASFRNDYENVADFEQQTDLTVPDDIAEMLGG